MYLVLAFVFHKYVPFGIQRLNSQEPVTNQNKKEERKYLVLLCQYKIHPAQRPRSHLVHPKAGARARPAAAAPRPGDTTPGSTAPGHSKGKSPPRVHITSGKTPNLPPKTAAGPSALWQSANGLKSPQMLDSRHLNSSVVSTNFSKGIEAGLCSPEFSVEV